MPAVAATVTRHGRAFSGAAAARVVGGVGRRTCPPAAALRLPRHDDGARAVMWPPRSWWAPLASERAFRLQLMRAGRALQRARLAAYKSDRRGRGGFLPLLSAFAVPAPCSSAPEPFLPLHLRSWSCSILRFFVPPPARMAPQQPLTIIDPRRGSARRRRRWPWVSWWPAASWRQTWTGNLRSGSCRRRRNEFPTHHTATSSASCASTSAA
jgi:hypothetical protein